MWTVPNDVIKANGFTDDTVPTQDWWNDPKLVVTQGRRQSHKRGGGSPKVGKEGLKYTVAEINHLRACIEKYNMDYSKESFVNMRQQEDAFWAPSGRNWSALREKAKKLANQGEFGFTVLNTKEVPSLRPIGGGWGEGGGVAVVVSKDVATSKSVATNKSKYSVAEIDHLRTCIEKYNMDYSKESFMNMRQHEDAFWAPTGRNWSALREKAKKLANQGEIGFTALNAKVVSTPRSTKNGKGSMVRKMKNGVVPFTAGCYVEVFFDDEGVGDEGLGRGR